MSIKRRLERIERARQAREGDTSIKRIIMIAAPHESTENETTAFLASVGVERKDTDMVIALTGPGWTEWKFDKIAECVSLR